MNWLDRWAERRYRKIIERASSAAANMVNEPFDKYPQYQLKGLSTSAVTIGTVGSGSMMNPSSSLRSRGMNFTIYPANGGHVLEYHNYNKASDESTTSLHIIPADQDMGQTISHAITVEMLKR